MALLEVERIDLVYCSTKFPGCGHLAKSIARRCHVHQLLI